MSEERRRIGMWEMRGWYRSAFGESQLLHGSVERLLEPVDIYRF